MRSCEEPNKADPDGKGAGGGRQELSSPRAAQSFRETVANLAWSRQNERCTRGTVSQTHQPIGIGGIESSGEGWLLVMLRVIGIIVLVLGGAGSVVARNSSAPQGLLGATYAELLPEQKALVDDWFRRFAEVVKKPVSAEEGYDSIPLSAKTTFSAVTHALIHTPLTDQSGAPLGASAITLIERLDTVAGKIPGTSGRPAVPDLCSVEA